MSSKIEKKNIYKVERTKITDHTFNRTKIVATVGPACNTYDKLLELVKAGVNVFRLNFSHGVYEEKKQIIDYIREINRKEKTHVAILGDLQGPK
ncbi:MAG TPA: pyruvate kinase, partial [Niabella sp.]|nr:pyruvate kinase [Niabella sp.]